MKMIQLEIWDGELVYINPTYIAAIYYEKYKDEDCTRVVLVGTEMNKGFLVKQTRLDILKLIENAE